VQGSARPRRRPGDHVVLLAARQRRAHIGEVRVGEDGPPRADVRRDPGHRRRVDCIRENGGRRRGKGRRLAQEARAPDQGSPVVPRAPRPPVRAEAAGDLDQPDAERDDDAGGGDAGVHQDHRREAGVSDAGIILTITLITVCVILTSRRIETASWVGH